MTPTFKDLVDLVSALVWPGVVFFLGLVFRTEIRRLMAAVVDRETKVSALGVTVELGKLAKEGQEAVNNLNRINYLMAESRLLELEIIEGKFDLMFSAEQRERMKNHIEELKKLTKPATNKAN